LRRQIRITELFAIHREKLWWVALDVAPLLRLTGRVIDDAKQLADFLGALRQAKWLAIDTEADSLHSYPEKLCLLQVAIPGQVELVDPLCGMDLDALWEALADRELMMHGADYDLRLLQSGHDFVPTRIFDTMLAGRLLGRERFGLADLVQHYLGITLEKGSQKANWAKRPLTSQMAEYARNDVLHLHDLVTCLREELQKKGRDEWHAQECAQLIKENTNLPAPDPDRIWRVKGSNRLLPAALAILRELWHWREQEARRRCRPPFFVLSHDLILSLADKAANGDDYVRLLPRRIPERRRQAIREVIERGVSMSPVDHPQPIKPPRRRNMSAQQKNQFEELQERRNKHAEELGIDPTIIASRATLMGLAQETEESSADLQGWQRELLAI
jgi:ribonuclease D